MWKARSGPPAPRPEAAQHPARVDAMADLARERAHGLRERLLEHVHLFLSPSEFLRRQFVEWGFPPDKVRHLATGVDTRAFHFVRRVPRGERLRVAFVGTLAPAKGPHLLLEAWGMLEPADRALGELALFGPDRHQPEYQRLLAKKAAEVGAALNGPLTRAGVIALLCETDLLVVPSVWYENAPLVILEAIACKTPLLVADLGGMAELVEEGVTGFHFETGNAGDLAAKLTRFLEEPELLEGLRSGLDHLRTSAELAGDVERVYREALDARR
jgi:glycosyltransferase involved in cell wall biosynthesis